MYYCINVTFFGFQAKGKSANMFYTCGPNEAMVVSGKMLALKVHYVTFLQAYKQTDKELLMQEIVVCRS